MSDKTIYTADWHYDPNQHLMNLKGKSYLDVQNRLVWFIRDQRDFINRGLASCSYVIRTELVEMDRQAGFAQFKTYVRDVLGNEATMYGSETAKDFGDYAEKASTKSLGRTLAMLGYGTQFAPEMDEGERVVDSPVTPAFVAKPPALKPATNDALKPFRAATPEQWSALRKLCAQVGATEPEPGTLTYERAGAMIGEYSETYKRLSVQRQLNGKTEAPR